MRIIKTRELEDKISRCELAELLSEEIGIYEGEPDWFDHDDYVTVLSGDVRHLFDEDTMEADGEFHFESPDERYTFCAELYGVSPSGYTTFKVERMLA